MPRGKNTSREASSAISMGHQLFPPEKGAVVRMYRIGHGDCFLVAFAGKTRDKPVYVLIDCGYKPGSPRHINTTPEEITQNIAAATGGHIHVAIITHEHQDHVNAITEKNFKGISIGKTWLAWTEDPTDEYANELRRIYKDNLLALLAARNLLSADQQKTKQIDRLLNFELGGEHEDSDKDATTQMLAAAAGGGKSYNKESMRVFKNKAKDGVKFLKPHDEIHTLPGAKDVRVFSFGPPRDLTKLKLLDPEGREEFHSMALAGAHSVNYFGVAAAAVDTAQSNRSDIPFARRYQVPWEEALNGGADNLFFQHHYGAEYTPEYYHPEDADEPLSPDEGRVSEVSQNASWRRIDKDWLYSAEQLAIKMNDETNNSSLVLAFELGKGGKVLLFAADAQRGNWKSWADSDWKDGTDKITTRDLLSRTVLYKVGHHCSHNATLNGKDTDDYPNLGWMATGKYSEDFTAMITAVWDWAKTQNNWIHPYPPIKDSLIKKTSGRIFQTDTKMEKPEGTPQVVWDEFMKRSKEDRLYFDYTIPA